MQAIIDIEYKYFSYVTIFNLEIVILTETPA